jgi:mannosyltransferase OCH1-like enzyme
MNIEKRIHQIWIGPRPAPVKWMNTWKEKHPDWQYEVFTQKDLEARTFKNQAHIDYYMSKKIYAGVSDLIRYELLYERGGFWPEADFICLENTEELFTSPPHHCYTCYENEKIRPGFVQPIFAANPQHNFLRDLIQEINSISPVDLSDKPWKSTGNEWLSHMIPTYHPDITIFPSHYFIPEHYSIKSTKYSGSDKIYAKHVWGSTSGGSNYSEGTLS